MLVRCPQEVIGMYDLYEIILKSECPTEDYEKFQKAVKELKEKLK